MKFNYINNFKILDNFNIEIEFDDKYKHIYKGITDFSFNRERNDIYNYTIVDYFTYKIKESKPNFLKNIFAVKCSKEFFNEEIKGKMSFLQIEGNLTIYAIYEELEILEI